MDPEPVEAGTVWRGNVTRAPCLVLWSTPSITVILYRDGHKESWGTGTFRERFKAAPTVVWE